MKKIVLIKPDAKGTVCTYPPLGIFYIASLLKNKGYPVKILDMADLDSEDELADEIKSGPLCVGISSMSGTQLKYALQYADFVKKLNREIPVVLGGVHVSIFPKHSLENNLIDIGVMGEGEVSMLELADALSAGKTLYGIAGIAFKDAGKVVINKKREFIELNTLPRLDYGLIKMEKYIDNSGTVVVHTGRGCCHKCKFCYNNFQGKRHRNFPVETIMDDIKILKRDFRIKRIKFIDDNMFSNRPFLKAITGGLIENNINIEWDANARISEFVKFDKELLDLIKKSGCRSIGFGVESGSQRMLDFIDKKVTVEQIATMRSILKEYDFSAYYYFLFGLPSETRIDFVQTLDAMNMLCLDPRKDVLNFYSYVPYPGTELYDFVIKKGLFNPPHTIEEWGSLDWNVCRIESFTRSFDPSLRAVRSIFKLKSSNSLYRAIFYSLFPLLKHRFTLIVLNKFADFKNKFRRLMTQDKGRKITVKN